ncbi:monovalent cation/H(+) antiporter subunit G [Nitrospira sp. Kam-Ns4a]
MKLVGLLLVLVGLGFATVAAVGLLRFPDVYSRSHAVGISDTLGLTLLIVGLACYEGLTLTALKLLLIVGFLLLVNPVISHVTARAALRCGLRPWTRQER